MKKIKEEELAMIINNETYTDYHERLKLLATSLFTWENLDKLCGTGATDFLEDTLFNEGIACFVNDDEIGFHIFKAKPNDKVNTYDLPTSITAFSHEYNKSFDLEDVVLIKNNILKRPTIASSKLFAYRLYETERTIDVNLFAQKTPTILEGDEKSIVSLKNVFMQYSGNIPVLFGNRRFSIQNKINAIKTDAPYIIDKLELHKHEIWNEALTYFGINNANTDKKERLVTDEVKSNNQLIRYYLNCYYNARKKACDEINEKFLKNSEIKLNIKINNENYDIIENEKEDNNE